MKNKILKRDLSMIAGLLQAEKMALRLTWMLNQVAKLPTAEEDFRRRFYANKAKILHHFDRRGYVEERKRDSEQTELLIIRIDDERASLHRKTRLVKNDARRFQYAERHEEELSDDVHLWFNDREEMYFALTRIIKVLDGTMT